MSNNGMFVCSGSDSPVLFLRGASVLRVRVEEDIQYKSDMKSAMVQSAMMVETPKKECDLVKLKIENNKSSRRI